MSDIIKLLPDSVANQIAAGEVIQRPASVVKELVENAVDAGATNIKIILKDAGRTLIQVVDNGCGMSPTDARLAFERHSTSKITNANDLFALHTMGFRGEALASICAVSQVELITMPRGETLGTRIVINGSELETQEPVAASPGTGMSVKNLFFNVPARRKFLKKDSVELSNIIREFERLALVNPGLGFELYHNDSLVHQLLPGPLKQRIGQLFGKSVERQLIPVEVNTSLVKISGFVGLPENARKKNALQYFFVNGRNMRHPYFHKAVATCYEKLIASDSQPNYFINFDVDPQTIDVNIHPTKNEIKFENEQPIWQIIVAAVRESLGRFNAVPAIDFNVTDSPDIPAFNPDSTAEHDIAVDSSYNPFAVSASGSKSGSTSSGRHSALSSVVTNWDKLYEGFERSTTPSADVVSGSSLNAVSDDFDFDGLGDDPGISTGSVGSRLNNESGFSGENVGVPVDVIQVADKYICTPTRNGLLVIDQHRAHVLILFERYMSSVGNGTVSTQQVFFPEVLMLSASQNVILDSIIDNVKELGFDISFLGDNSWAVNGVPSVIGKHNPLETLVGLIDNVNEGIEDESFDMNRRLALAMAKATAIPGGKKLSTLEMDSLISDLFRLVKPAYTPDGLPVMSVIETGSLEKMLEK